MIDQATYKQMTKLAKEFSTLGTRMTDTVAGDDMEMLNLVLLSAQIQAIQAQMINSLDEELTALKDELRMKDLQIPQNRLAGR